MRRTTLSRSRLSCVSALTICIAVTALPLTARAQAGEAAQRGVADKLWEEAYAAMDKQDYATACPKLEEVVRLRPDGLGAKLKLAKCYEGAGRLASAWAMYLLVEPLAEKANQSDRQKTAHERAEALMPKLARLTIVVPDAVRALPGVEVTCDGKVVAPAQWGTAMPVDSGRHVIGVTATARERGERVAEVESDGVSKSVTIDLPAGVKPPGDAKPAESRRSMVPAVVLGTLAAVGVGSGIALMALSASNLSSADALRGSITANHGSCVPHWASYDKQCPALQDKLSAADTFHNTAVVTFVAGGAAAAGAILYLLWPSPRAKATELSAVHDLRLTPILGPTGSGLLVSGSF